MADGDVAAVGVAVQGRVGLEDHGVEDAGERGGDFGAGDGVRVHVSGVVDSGTTDAVHDEDAFAGGDDFGDDEGEGGVFAEEVAGVHRVFAFEREVEFFGDGEFHFIGQPFHVVVGKGLFEGLESDSGESEVEGDPFLEAGVLDLDGDFLLGVLEQCCVDLG